MAELRATVVNGDLEVTGNIIPWGGERTGYAYIGNVQFNCAFGSIDSYQSSSTTTFTPTLLEGTNYFTVNVIGGNYGNMFDIVLDQENKNFKARCMNLTTATHTLTVRCLIECYKKL